MSIADIFNWIIHTNIFIVIAVFLLGSLALMIILGFIFRYFEDDKFKKEVNFWFLVAITLIAVGSVIYTQF